MIIPIGAPQVYVVALKEAVNQYSLGVVRTPEEINAFCDGFRSGWEGSTNATFQVLNRLEEGKDDE